MFDLAIVGGGINGAGIARDAAGRGARVLLLERGDLGSGTSSASTKLIHGGLRYLEHFEFALVREALYERERLWRIAPHLIQPMRFVLPAAKGQRPRALIRAGLFLYDHLGGRGALPGTRSIRLERHPAGAPLIGGKGRGFEYSDCWCDDARLVIANARDAARLGATILPRHELGGAHRSEGLWELSARGRRFTARALVNAAGPQLAPVARSLGIALHPSPRLVRGSHIVVPRMFDHPYAYFFQNEDGRILFAIPYEGAFTLIGTTDVDHEDPLQPPRASEGEIAYLMASANAQFRRQLSRDDIVWTYSGVRPLVADDKGRPENASRGYRLELTSKDEGPPLLTVLGGKITTYRHLAERAVDRLSSRISAVSGPSWTATAALPGGDFPASSLAEMTAELLADYPFLGDAGAERIMKAYGTEARSWLGEARGWSDLGRSFGAGLSEAEVRFMIDEEFAGSSEDILWRRSKLGLHIDAGGRRSLGEFFGEKAA